MSMVTVWFDAACPLCSREVALMRRLDRRRAITFLDIGESGTLCPVDRAALLARFHAQEANGPLLSGAAAFAAMWRAIPVLRPLGLAARNTRVLRGLERLYLAFLRVRPALTRHLLRA
jgi:predicted DCC family thiol-disulfide oxidoreductase YuxK